RAGPIPTVVDLDPPDGDVGAGSVVAADGHAVIQLQLSVRWVALDLQVLDRDVVDAAAVPTTPGTDAVTLNASASVGDEIPDDDVAMIRAVRSDPDHVSSARLP